MGQDLGRLAAALEHERDTLVEEDRRLRALGVRERVLAGYTVQPLEVLSVEHRSRGRVNVVLRGVEMEELFTAGDPVVLGPSGKVDGIDGRVEGVDRVTIELRLYGVPE